MGFFKWLFKKPRIELYGLDHAVLNIQLPPQTMWMNMGYWKKSTTAFPEACQALLDQVLEAGPLKAQSPQSIRLLDVGCGCGDQSVYLASLQKDTSTNESRSDSQAVSSSINIHPPSTGNHSKTGSSPLINNYIGITLEPSQAAMARRRVQGSRRAENISPNTAVDIFCADAANPGSWSGDLQYSIESLKTTSESLDQTTWLLALDTIYHFRPSRLPILQFACNSLQASYMAFDLALGDDVSWFQRFILRIVCSALGAPFGNIVTQDELKGILIKAGYEPGRIEMKDISRHVFGGLSDFLERRVEEASPFGLKMGKYRVAKKVFDWWARTGVIKGFVVVARKS
ncbi:hypothetical protein N7456_002023 [Penicillium angulare]|uniref:S-adenosyl-L-methionine-dependent methyltransferase n=1 Tax=Penicillium angulare TaxID=116970 RepID=A0A9W9KNM5_9EURO|nr:hypothetical protein N7456_002023 [Penicillium angulare]